MNVYDFDGTILAGDTEEYFKKYIFKNYHISYKSKLEVNFYGLLFKLNLIDSDKLLKHFYVYLKELDNIDNIVKAFWDDHKKYIKEYYYKNHQEDDVVVSATPRFLLEYISKELKINTLIATEMDKNTGILKSKVCKGIEKVNRYNEIFHERKYDNYYFDSDTDIPLMKYSTNGYRLYGDKLVKVK